MIAPLVVSLESNTAGIEAEIEQAVSSLKRCKASPDRIDGLLAQIDDLLLNERGFDLDMSSASADKMIVRLKLSQAFLDVVAAFVAANSEDGVLEHGRSVSRIAEAGPDLNSGPACFSHDSEQSA